MKKSDITEQVVAEWLVLREFQKMQERGLAEMWRQEFQDNESTKLWLKLIDEEE